MYPPRDTVILHYDVQPRCVILKQYEWRTDEQSAAPPAAPPDPSRDRGSHAPGSHRLGLLANARGGVRTSALHSPTKRSSGARAMTTSALRRAITPSGTHRNNAGRSTTDRG